MQTLHTAVIAMSANYSALDMQAAKAVDVTSTRFNAVRKGATVLTAFQVLQYALFLVDASEEAKAEFAALNFDFAAVHASAKALKVQRRKFVVQNVGEITLEDALNLLESKTK